jgi:catechol 2,3-dioxygenase-like lactoylglutathione lyase family enzyme
MATIMAEDTVFITVTNLNLAKAWYLEKLGCHVVNLPKEPDTVALTLPIDDVLNAVLRFIRTVHPTVDVTDVGTQMAVGGFDPDPPDIVLQLKPTNQDSRIPVLFSSNVPRAHKKFASRNVVVTRIQSDRQGHKFFEFQDLDGNRIEVCQQT